MAAIPSKHTKPELFVRSLVHRLGYRFRLHSAHLPGSPDLVFSGRRKVIFVNGCFWHRHENCRRATTPKTNVEFWSQKFCANMERDQVVQEELERLQWKPLVVWQCELKDPKKLAERIDAFLKRKV